MGSFVNTDQAPRVFEAPSYHPEYIREWLRTHRGPQYHQTRPNGAVQPFPTLTGRRLEEVYAQHAQKNARESIEQLTRALTCHRPWNPELQSLDPDTQGEEILKTVNPNELWFRARSEVMKTEVRAQAVAPRCECGAAKTGVADFGAGHSSWCPVSSRP